MRVGVYMNKTVESRIDSLLEKMSLREKLGQLTPSLRLLVQT